jgi:hypothetical protein
MNNDGLYIKYGTELAVPTTGGDYCMPGELREQEVTIDLTKMTTSAQIVADTTFFPANVFVEQVEVVADEGAAGGTSVSVGLVQMDRTTAISTTAFVAALITSTINSGGEKNIITGGTTYAGTKVGTTSGTLPGYITCLVAGTYTDGVIKVRIKYRGVTDSQ